MELYLERHSTVPGKVPYSSEKFITGLRMSNDDFDADITAEELSDRVTEVMHRQHKADLMDHEIAGVAADPRSLKSIIDSL